MHSPHPFQHKINTHQRDDFIQSARVLIYVGRIFLRRRLAVPVQPLRSYHSGALRPDVTKTNLSQLMKFLSYLDLDTPEKLGTAADCARRVYEHCFTLACQIDNALPDYSVYTLGLKERYF